MHKTSSYSVYKAFKSEFCVFTAESQYRMKQKLKLGSNFPGTFNDRVHQDNISDCVPCSAGRYCDRTGLSEPTGNCTAGYLCLSGATQPEPNDGTNGPCPMGHYCLTGIYCQQGL